MVEGVTNGYEKRLEIQGVGFKAAVKGNILDLNLGFTHEGWGPSFSSAWNAADQRVSVYFSASYPIERSADQPVIRPHVRPGLRRERELLRDSVQPRRLGHEVLGVGAADREAEMVIADDALAHHPVADGHSQRLGHQAGGIGEIDKPRLRRHTLHDARVLQRGTRPEGKTHPEFGCPRSTPELLPHRRSRLARHFRGDEARTRPHLSPGVFVGSRCANGLNQPGQLVRAKRLFQAGGCAVLVKLAHSFRVVTVDQRDDRRRRSGVSQGFDDGEALQIRAEVHDGHIDLFQCEAEDVEGVLGATGLHLTTCAIIGKIIAVVTDQDNIPFHKD